MTLTDGQKEALRAGGISDEHIASLDSAPASGPSLIERAEAIKERQDERKRLDGLATAVLEDQGMDAETIQSLSADERIRMVFEPVAGRQRVMTSEGVVIVDTQTDFDGTTRRIGGTLEENLAALSDEDRAFLAGGES